MALGWRGTEILDDLYRYSFSESTWKLFEKIKASGFSFGCRDFLTEKVLRNNGIGPTIMTECAAWYDLQYVDSTKIENAGEIRKICVSDPGNFKYHAQSVDVCRYLQQRYPDAEIVAVFHRGIQADGNTDATVAASNLKTQEALNKTGIRTEDISYSTAGGKIYEDCDLHVGYRVHAHIFNLSQRRRSLLIEEDSRGAGVNDALGLPGIHAYSELGVSTRDIDRVYRYVYGRLLRRQVLSSPYLLPELDSCLNRLEETDFAYIIWAYQRMQRYYERMREHLKQLEAI